MGEKQNQPFQLSFNASLKVDFQGSRVTSDGGLILIHELDERLGLDKLIREETGPPVSIVDDPLTSVVLGTGKMLSDFHLLRLVSIDYDMKPRDRWL